MRIRYATFNDAQDIFEWRNDISSRKMFFNSHNVSFDEHLVWFTEALKSDDCVLLIGLIGDKKLGVCRFDINVEEDSAEVSINLNPEFRGKGLSKKFLRTSISSFLKSRRLILTAQIKNINTASTRIFESSGFGFIYEEKDVRYYRLS